MKAFLTVFILSLTTQPTSSNPAVVNSHAIPAGLVDLSVARLPSLRYHKPSVEKMADYRRDALNRLIDCELLYSEAQKRGIAPKDSDVASVVERDAKRLGGEKKLREALAARGLSLDAFLRWIERDMACAAVEKQVAEFAEVDDKAARQHYDSNLTLYVQPAKVHPAMLLFKVPPVPAPGVITAQEEVASRAAAIWRANPTTDAAEFAAELQGQYVDLGELHLGAAIEPLNDSIAQLQVGGVSEPVQSIYGWHVIKLLTKRPPAQLSYKQVEGQIKESLKKKHAEAAMEGLLARLRSQADITVAE